jgi:hypothetical protein
LHHSRREYIYIYIYFEKGLFKPLSFMFLMMGSLNTYDNLGLEREREREKMEFK